MCRELRREGCHERDDPRDGFHDYRTPAITGVVMNVTPLLIVEPSFLFSHHEGCYERDIPRDRGIQKVGSTPTLLVMA